MSSKVPYVVAGFFVVTAVFVAMGLSSARQPNKLYTPNTKKRRKRKARKVGLHVRSPSFSLWAF
jgi:hypothetical protein